VAGRRQPARHRLRPRRGRLLAAYILLTQAVGDEVAGLEGLAVSIPVAALVSTPFAATEITKALTPHLLLVGFGLALLLPVIPFALEMSALRRLTTAAFGTLMCLEPALALLAGLALLGQVPQVWALAGVALVVAAGLGAERAGARHDDMTPQENPAGPARDPQRPGSPAAADPSSVLVVIATKTDERS